MKKRLIGVIFDALLLITGLISEIFAIVCLSYNEGYSVVRKEFGGDAYTEIHSAAAMAANNIERLNRILKFGFAAILIVAGLVIIATALKRIISALAELSEEKKAKQAQFVQSPEFQARMQRAAAPAPAPAPAPEAAPAPAAAPAPEAAE